jgi:glycosyltransferase involved in cell wall biosynthesis
VRILHVNKFLFRKGGAEGYMLDVAELQRRAGHEVQLWGMHHPDNPPLLPLRDTFASYVDLEHPTGGLSAVSTAARMIWSPSSKHGLEKALQRFRPDVVHCHNTYHQLSPAILRAIHAAGIPSVMTLHDYKLACPSYQMLDHGELCDRCVTGGTWHAAKQRCKDGSLLASSLLSLESGIHRLTGAYDSVGVFISPSRFLADVMLRSGVAGARIKVINHFVDELDGPVADGTADGFVFAGRLAPEKGVDTLIEAVALLPQGTRLAIAGDGPARASLEQLAHERAPSRVEFLGRLDAGRLRELVAGSIASVVPSRWYENQPMTILESFTAAVPVVASDLGGIPELVRNEKDGLLAPPNDPAALARTMSRLVDDRAWAHRMGVQARSRMMEKFNAKAHLDALTDLYSVTRKRA